MMHTLGHEASCVLVFGEGERDARAHESIHDRQDFAARNTERMTAPGIEQFLSDDVGSLCIGRCFRSSCGFHVTVSRLREFPSEDLRCHEGAQYLCCAAADRKHSHVASHALDRIIAGISARAEQLQRIVNDLDSGFGGENLGLGGKLWVRERTVVRTPRGGSCIKHETRCGQLGLYICQHPLQA